MAKFYVESGELRKIVEASSPICAAATAMAMIGEHDDLELARVVIVNERGFVRDRPYRRHQMGDMVLETGTLLAMLAEAEF